MCVSTRRKNSFIIKVDCATTLHESYSQIMRAFYQEQLCISNLHCMLSFSSGEIWMDISDAGISCISTACIPSWSPTPYITLDHVSLLGPLQGLSWNTILTFDSPFLLSLGLTATSIYLVWCLIVQIDIYSQVSVPRIWDSPLPHTPCCITSTWWFL